jgi:hypothetical protein
MRGNSVLTPDVHRQQGSFCCCCGAVVSPLAGSKSELERAAKSGVLEDKSQPDGRRPCRHLAARYTCYSINSSGSKFWYRCCSFSLFQRLISQHSGWPTGYQMILSCGCGCGIRSMLLRTFSYCSDVESSLRAPSKIQHQIQQLASWLDRRNSAPQKMQLIAAPQGD